MYDNHHVDPGDYESDYAGEYDRPARDFLTAEYERLSLFGMEAENYQTQR